MGEQSVFGYVKPVKPELLVKEYEFYRATYCGICRAMKKKTGGLSRLTLSYDSVFLALLRMLYIPDSEIGVERKVCPLHPLKKRPMIKTSSAIEYTARAFAILTYYKLRDDLSDERGLKKALVTAARPIASGAKKRAGIPELEEIVADRLLKISELEASDSASADEPASLFGKLLGELFSYGLPEEDRLVPYECGYHLGRFIYCADAAEDYGEDAKAGKYNPYVLAYGGAPLTAENRATIKCALLLECKKIEAAVALLPFGSRAMIENIINNIIYLGLVKRIEFLDGEEKKEK